MVSMRRRGETRMPEQLGVATMVLADAPVSINANTAPADKKSTKAETLNMCSVNAQQYAK